MTRRTMYSQNSFDSIYTNGIFGIFGVLQASLKAGRRSLWRSKFEWELGMLALSPEARAPRDEGDVVLVTDHPLRQLYG
jgi:hypothetical protein